MSIYGRIVPEVGLTLTRCCGKLLNECRCNKEKTLGSRVLNIFCKTGQGGGIDPTCGTGKSSSGSSFITPRRAPPKSSFQARDRFDEVSTKVFGATGGGGSYFKYEMSGGRFIEVRLKEKVDPIKSTEDRTAYHFDIRVDFGVTGRASHTVSDKVNRESVAMVRKAKEAVEAFHKAGFRIEVEGADQRRKDAYEKMLKKAGMDQLAPEGSAQIWNMAAHFIDNRLGVENVFCKTGQGGGIDPSCGSGKSGSSGNPSIQASIELSQAYHGTPLEVAKKIMKEGLKRGQEETVEVYGWSRPPSVYMNSNITQTHTYVSTRKALIKLHLKQTVDMAIVEIRLPKSMQKQLKVDEEDTKHGLDSYRIESDVPGKHVVGIHLVKEGGKLEFIPNPDYIVENTAKRPDTLFSPVLITNLTFLQEFIRG